MSAIEKVLDQYSSRVYKNRKEHMVAVDNNDNNNQIAANVRTIPGIITQRGCCYAGCKGVVLGPIKDALQIVHGPIGCSYYAWGTRRHKGKNEEGVDNYLQYCFSTDMQEPDIVFGGEKKLQKAITEAMDLFNPSTIFICSTCPVGLIGDDIHAVAKWAEKEYGIKCIAYSCEGYKGVSQSAGHHIANNQIMRFVIGEGDREIKNKFSVNILGEYNIGGDGWETERILKRIGYEVVSTFTGDSSIEDLKNAHLANLSLVQCHRSINYIAEMIEEKYGTPWMKVNFIGVKGAIKTLRDIARYFNDPELTKKTEEVIAEELGLIQDDMAYYKSKLKGKTAAIYVGGSRAHHYQTLLNDLGVSTILAGYEFAHRDEYEGREVLPFIKTDADSKNIETIKVEPDTEKYHLYISEEELFKLREEKILNDYGGMVKDMTNGTYMVDDLNHFETEELLKILKPDIFFSGIKDKFVAQKNGVLSRQLHSYDYSGPYAGFRGAVNFARDVTMGIYTPAWSYVKVPWKTTPILEGTLGGE
ncbi:MAG: nitrogenase component alpha chain [Anaerocolumna sp.]|jgi:nitrogenase molybdenum-iron protein alpha chain|nr:nitrogenase component alpha chain [Anaerocolumna sp.]